jgi:hypothetical protein
VACWAGALLLDVGVLDVGAFVDDPHPPVRRARLSSAAEAYITDRRFHGRTNAMG